MKKKYVKPSVSVVVMGDELCSNGLTLGSVQTQEGKHVDQFEVVEKEQSENQYDWDFSSGSWGGN